MKIEHTLLFYCPWVYWYLHSGAVGTASIFIFVRQCRVFDPLCKQIIYILFWYFIPTLLSAKVIISFCDAHVTNLHYVQCAHNMHMHTQVHETCGARTATASPCWKAQHVFTLSHHKESMFGIIGWTFSSRSFGF